TSKTAAKERTPTSPITMNFARIATLFLLIAVSSSVHAQSTASIEGQVTDQNLEIVPAAEVTALNYETDVKRTAVTDESGRYQLVALAVGAYRIEVKAPGFQTQIIERLTVEVGKRITQSFQLQVGNISQVVIVSTEHDLL